MAELLVVDFLRSQFDQDQPSFLYLPDFQDWIMKFPTNAGKRAIMIGVALGIIGTSLRIIFGIDRSFIGERN